MKRIGLCVGLTVALAASGLAFAQPPASQIDPLKKQRDEIAKQVKAKHKQLGELRGELLKSPEFAALRDALSTALQSHRDKVKKDPEIQAAAKAREKADAAVAAAITAEVTATPEGAAAVKALAAAEAKLKEAHAAVQTARQKVGELKASVAKKSAKLKDPRAAAAKAAEVYAAIVAKRAQAEKAAAVLNTKVDAKLAALGKAVAIKAEIDALTKRDRELNDKIRDLQKPPKRKVEPAKKEAKKDRAKPAEKPKAAEQKAK